MASLREIKDHIASVRSTLKITSAMKLVASAKFRKAQQAAEGIRPYTEALATMLARVLGGGEGIASDPVRGVAAHPSQAGAWAPPSNSAEGGMPLGGNTFAAADPSARGKGPGRVPQGEPGPGIAPPTAGAIAIVAVASNSSLCGAFNINVIHKVQEVIAGCRADGVEVEVFSVGRKMAEAMRKAGYPSPGDYSDLVGRCSFEKASAFAQTLIDSWNAGRYSRILFIYNHFVTTSSQKVTVEQYLPFSAVPSSAGFPSETAATLGINTGGSAPSNTPAAPGLPTSPLCGSVPASALHSEERSEASASFDFILEPSREEILATLLPQVMRLRVYTVLLDSIAAEHAARMVAMQTASDNAEDLLSELTLEYNKSRQQKITSEILDLVAGAQQ